MTNGLCWWKDAPSKADLDACQPRWRAEFEAAQPKVFIALGEIIGDYFFGEEQKRGAMVWSKEFNCWTMKTNHPSSVIRGTHVNIFNIMRDFMKLKDVLTWPNAPLAEIDYQVIYDSVIAQALLDALPKDEPVALDVESRYKTGKEILCVGVSSSQGTFVFHKDCLPGLKWPEDVLWTMHNGLFDRRKMKEELGANIWIAEDTLLQSYSLDERGGGEEERDDNMKVGVHGLKTLLSEFRGQPLYDIKGIEKEWDKGPEGEQAVMRYNAIDTEGTRWLVNYQRPKQEKDNVRGMYENILIPAANALGKVREHGVFIDQEATAMLYVPWALKEIELRETLQDESGVENLGSPKQIAHYIYDVLGLNPPQISKNNIVKQQIKTDRTTNKFALEMFKEEVPWVRKLLEWRQVEHMINTYMRGVLDDLEEDGRIHPDPIIHGTRTGRLAYRNPPVQTIPLHTEVDRESREVVGLDIALVRGMFAAPPPHPKFGEMELIEADYRQAELWVAHFWSGDEGLLEALETGDFHGATAQDIFDVNPSDANFALRRYESKRVTFGILYGRGVNSLVESFGHNERYWGRAIDTWSKKYWRYWERREQEKKNVIRDGEQQALSGRKRRYWIVLNHNNLNEAINMPIQTMGHEHLLMSVIKLVLQERLEPFGAHVLFEVHDSIMFESPVAKREPVLRTIREVMEEPMFGFPRGLTVDIKAGKSWLTVKPV